MGHGDLGSALGISSYPVIRFELNKDTIYFNGNINIDFVKGKKLPIRYQKSNPQEARVDNFVCIWMDILPYALLPIGVLLVLYFMPDSLDPIIPRRSKIIIGKKPFLQIIKPNRLT